MNNKFFFVLITLSLGHGSCLVACLPYEGPQRSGRSSISKQMAIVDALCTQESLGLLAEVCTQEDHPIQNVLLERIEQYKQAGIRPHLRDMFYQCVATRFLLNNKLMSNVTAAIVSLYITEQGPYEYKKALMPPVIITPGDTAIARNRIREAIKDYDNSKELEELPKSKRLKTNEYV